MKNIIFKSLVIGAMVFGVSLVSNAQDSQQPDFQLKKVKVEKIKDISYLDDLRAIKNNKTPKKKNVIRKRATVKESSYTKLEKAQVKSVIK